METFYLMIIFMGVFFFLLLYRPKTSDKNVLSDDKILADYINKTLKKLNYNKKVKYIGNSIRRFIFLGILALITFLDISYIFIYHNNFGIAVVIEMVAIILLIYSMTKVNTLNAIKKKIKSSPDNDMEYIIASFYEESSQTKKIMSVIITFLGFVLILIGIIFPLIIFAKPHVIYERQGNEYCVRYYTMALIPEKNIEIPEKYNGKDVVGIRGNVFINLSSIESIKLPDTISEIRSSAFKNCTNLESINLPVGLNEIKGNTFENDKSLKQVVIPEGVTRIGGHAFYGCKSLKNVSVPQSVKEIGSSAFRLCTSLKEIDIPSKAVVNNKAFKGTTTKIHYIDENGNEVYKSNGYNSGSKSNDTRNVNANNIVRNVFNNINMNSTNAENANSSNESVVVYNGLK